MEYDLTHIDKYVLGQMTPDELADFEKKLTTDASLKKDVETYREMLDFGKDKTQIEKALAVKDQIHAEFTYQKPVDQPISSSQPQQTGNSKYLWLALGLVLIALLGYLLLSPSAAEEAEPQVYYATYFNPDEISLTTRSDSDEELKAQITSLYNDKRYPEAIDVIQQLESEESLSARLRFIKGVAHLGADQDDQAISTLQNLLEEHPEYKSDISWYLALAHLKNGDAALARLSLNKIEGSSNYYADAQKIVGGLKDK